MASVLAETTLVGNIGKVFPLRHTGKDNGNSVIDFTVGVTPRKKVGDEWKDGDTVWNTVTAWGKLAENVEKSFNTGDRVFVTGRVEMKNAYTRSDGTEAPARPIIIANFAGLEIGRDAAHSDRQARSNNTERHEERAAAPARPAARKEPVKTSFADDLNLDDDDIDLDLGDDDVPF